MRNRAEKGAVQPYLDEFAHPYWVVVPVGTFTTVLGGCGASCGTPASCGLVAVFFLGRHRTGGKSKRQGKSKGAKVRGKSKFWDIFAKSCCTSTSTSTST